MPIPDSSPSNAMTETAFAAFLAEQLRSVGTLGVPAAGGTDAGHLRERYARLAEQASILQRVLDDHGARWNRAFVGLAEAIASLRGFSRMGVIVAQLQRKTGTDVPVPPKAEGSAWGTELGRTRDFVDRAIDGLLSMVDRESQRTLGRTCQGPAGTLSSVMPHAGSVCLPRNIAEDTVPDPERWIIEIASKLLASRSTLREQSSQGSWEDEAAMRRFVLEVSDEQQVRFFATRIHNLLSRYDTYIQGTEVETSDERLPRLRSYVAVCWMILEIMVELVHFYERHENDIRCVDAKNEIAGVVDKREVLDRILNWCLHFLHIYMDELDPQARELVAAYTRHSRVSYDIPEGVMLHARPISLIARVVAHYGTPVTLTAGDGSCYAGSILQMLMTLGSRPEVRTIGFEGDAAPLADLQKLVESGFGEGDRKLPAELSYLMS